MLQAALLAALAAPLQSGAAPEPVAPLRGEHWFELANRLEFELRFDESIIARIEGLRLDDDEQERRELARQLQHVAGRVATIRPEVPVEHLPESVQWSAAGGRIAVQGDRLRVHDATTGEALFTTGGAGLDGRPALDISPDGRLLAQGRRPLLGRELVVYDVISGLRLFELHGDRELIDVDWSGDGTRVAATFDSKDSKQSVEVRRLPDGELLRSFELEGANAWQARLSHNGQWLAVSSYDDTAVWSVETGEAHATTSGPYSTLAMAWHPREPRLALRIFEDGYPWIFDFNLDKWEMVRGPHIYNSGEPHEICFDASLNRWVELTGHQLGSFQSRRHELVPNLLREKDPIEYDGDRLPLDIAIAPDGSLAIRRTNGNTYTTWDTRTGRRLAERLAYGDWRASVGFADPTHVVLVEPSGVVRIIDPYTEEIGPPLPDPSVTKWSSTSPWIGEGSVHGVCLRRSSEITVHGIDGASGSLPRFGGQLSALVSSPAGDSLAARDDEGLTVIWDLKNPPSAPRALPRIPSLRSVAFTPTGDRLITTSHEVTVGLWDVATLTLRETLDWVNPGHAEAVLPYVDGREEPPDLEVPYAVARSRDDYEEESKDQAWIVSSSDCGHLLVNRTEQKVTWCDIDGSAVQLSESGLEGRTQSYNWAFASVHRDRVLVEDNETTHIVDPLEPAIIGSFDGDFCGAASGAALIRSESGLLLVDVVNGAELGRFDAGEDVISVAPVDMERVAMLRSVDELRSVDLTVGGEGIPIAISPDDVKGAVVLPGEVAVMTLDGGENLRVDLRTGISSIASRELVARAEESRTTNRGQWLEIESVPPRARLQLLHDPDLGLPFRISRAGIAAFSAHRFARLGPDGVTPIKALRRPVGASVLDASHGGRGFFGDGLYLTQWTQTVSGFAPIVLEVGPSSMPPVEGDPDDLMEEWGRRLALRIDPRGRIEPITFEPR